MASVRHPHLYPRYHVRPEAGFVNDPNGPIGLGQRTHLYFQRRLTTGTESPVLWGHASSADLVNWEHHRPAIAPQPGGPDQDGCWSGNIVEHEGRIHAFYSAYRRGKPYQSVVMATSVDGGYSFGPPVRSIPDPDPAEGVVHFRDPFVWEEDGAWRAVVGAGYEDGFAAARLYTSPDLSSWSYDGDLVRQRPMDGNEHRETAMFECPQVLSGSHRTAVLAAPWRPTAGGSDVVCLSGACDGRAIATPVTDRVDHGPNFYAPSVMRTDEGGFVWGWATEGRSAGWAVEDDWSGMLTLPRRAELLPDGGFGCDPPAALAGLRGEPLPARPGDPASGMITDTAQFELELRLAPTRSSGSCTLRVRCGRDERMDLAVDRASGELVVDRNRASSDARADGGTFRVDAAATGSATLPLRVLVDGSIAEIFTPSRRCATIRFYPTTPPPWQIDLADPDPEDRLTGRALRPVTPTPSPG